MGQPTAQKLPYVAGPNVLFIATSAWRFAGFSTKPCGLRIAPSWRMKPLSEKRKRTLALQDRAESFSVGVNACCPERSPNAPSQTVWEQLAAAADSVSNNLVEADAASSTADFINKMQLTLREAKESKVCLAKIRRGRLAGFEKAQELQLEQEAGELSAIFASIVLNVARRVEREQEQKRRTAPKRKPKP